MAVSVMLHNLPVRPSGQHQIHSFASLVRQSATMWSQLPYLSLPDGKGETLLSQLTFGANTPTTGIEACGFEHKITLTFTLPC